VLSEHLILRGSSCQKTLEEYQANQTARAVMYNAWFFDSSLREAINAAL
jgi:hypothetical protein